MTGFRFRDPQRRPALHAEVQLWHELDRARLDIYQKAVRPYLKAVNRADVSPEADLAVQHQARVRCAERHLPMNPVADFGVVRLIGEAREAVGRLVNPAALGWLPDVRDHFKILEQ